MWRSFWVSVLVMLAFMAVFGPAGEQDRRDAGVDLTEGVDRVEVMAWAR